MEKTGQSDYNENNAPPPFPPTHLNQQTYQGHFVYHQPVGTYPNVASSGLHTDFNQRPNFVPLPQPAATTVPSYMPPQQHFRDSYSCSRLFRNRRQCSSIAGGLILMVISGLHIGWGIWRTIFLDLWSATTSASLLTFIIMAWSLGAIVGGFVGSVLMPILRKNFIYYLSAGIMIVGNLLFVIWDADSEAIVVGRLLLGGAHGIAYVALITHAGENSAKNMRGTILSILNCMLYTGIFVSVVITGTVRFGFTISGERIVAIVGILLAVASVACSIMMTIESVPFILQLNRSSRERAMINLKHLRDTPHETLELTREMDEFDLMIVQDKHNSGNVFTNGNAKPLVLMIVMRLMVALTNNFLINAVTIAFVSQMFYLFQYRLAPLAVVGPRLFMSIVQIFYADVFKRKLLIIISFISAASLIILAGILFNVLSLFYLLNSIVIAILWLAFQLSCSIGMDQMQDVYLSEAFSTAKKPWSISFVAAVEHLFHVFMIGMFFVGIDTTTTVHLNVVIFVSAAAITLFGLILVVALPETHNLSLKQAKDSFHNFSRNIFS